MKMTFMGMLLVFLCMSSSYAFAAEGTVKRGSEDVSFNWGDSEGNPNDFFGSNQSFFNSSDSLGSVTEPMKCRSGEILAYYTCTCRGSQFIAQACSSGAAKRQAEAKLSCSDVKCSYCGTNSFDT